MKHHIYRLLYTFETTKEEEDEVLNLTELKLYDHLVGFGVGIIRPNSDPRHILPYTIGNIEIYVSLSEPLKKLRECVGRANDTSCMDLCELKDILGAFGTPEQYCKNLVEVRVWYKEISIIRPQYMTLLQLIDTLKRIVLRSSFFV